MSKTLMGFILAIMALLMMSCAKERRATVVDTNQTVLVSMSNCDNHKIVKGDTIYATSDGIRLEFYNNVVRNTSIPSKSDALGNKFVRLVLVD